MKILCAILVGLWSLSAWPANYYTSPVGSPSGDGTRVSPWDLPTALANNTVGSNPNHVVSAGDTIWMLPGTYGVGTNIYMCYLLGASNNPIVVRAIPGQRAIVNGNIDCSGPANWTTFWGFELTCSNERTNVYANRPAGLIMSNQGHKAVNLVIHDSGHPGILGGGSEIYGCVLWGVGIYEVDSMQHPSNLWVRGSGLYLQNAGNYDFLVQDNISSRNFTSGMKAYAENGYVERFIFDGNIVFKNDGESVEAECLYHSITNATVINNVSYRSRKTPMGYFGQNELSQHYSLTYSNNYDINSPGMGVSSLWVKRWQSPTIIGNTIVTTSPTNEWTRGTGVGSDMGGHFMEVFLSTNAPLSYTINSNAYYGGVEQDSDWYSFTQVDGTNVYGMFYHTYQPFFYNTNVTVPDGTNGLISFQAWTNSHGFDVNGTYTTNMPTSNVVVLRTNKYELGRANLVVINWQSNAVLNLDVASCGYTQGQLFAVRDVQNYFGTPVLVTNYDAATHTAVIPLTSTNITPLLGNAGTNYTFNGDAHTASLFNVFVLDPSYPWAGTTVSGSITGTGAVTIQ